MSLVPYPLHHAQRIVAARYLYALARGDGKYLFVLLGNRNQIYICIDPLREDFDLRFRGDNVVPVLMYSYRRNGLDVFLQFLRSRYAGIMSTAQLYIYDCTADEFMQDDNFPNAVEGFGEIVVKQE